MNLSLFPAPSLEGGDSCPELLGHACIQNLPSVFSRIGVFIEEGAGGYLASRNGEGSETQFAVCVPNSITPCVVRGLLPSLACPEGFSPEHLRV